MKYEGQKMEVHTPKNTTTISLKFKGEKMMKVVGEIAQGGPKQSGFVSGVLVRKDYVHHLMTPSDIQNYTASLKLATLKQTMSVPFTRDLKAFAAALASLFNDVSINNSALSVSAQRTHTHAQRTLTERR